MLYLGYGLPPDATAASTTGIPIIGIRQPFFPFRSQSDIITDDICTVERALEVHLRSRRLRGWYSEYEAARRPSNICFKGRIGDITRSIGVHIYRLEE